MKKFHLRQYYEKYPPHPSLNFWYSMIRLSQHILDKEIEKTVLDFGCGTGEFLHLYELMDSLKTGVGLEIDCNLLEKCNELSNEKINYYNYEIQLCEKYRNYFDVAFSQEVIYTLQDMKQHAEFMFTLIKPGGFYFASIGCHIENPLWSLRRKIIRQEEEYYAYDYSIDEIADVFYAAGFEVGAKKLAPALPYIYNPEITRAFSNSLTNLIDTTDDRKILFSFYKPL